MRQPQRTFPRISLLLLATALAACDQQGPGLPTEARAEAGLAGLAPLMSAGTEAVPDRYIVVLHGGQVSASSTVAREVVAAHGGKVHHTYAAVLNGFAATLSPAGVDALRRDPRVAYVAQDAMTYPTQTTQPGATWGLDRVDQRALPLNTTYTYSRTGSGVRVYVIDSGILTAHTQFGGRASVGTDYVGDGQNGQDCNGHGTHVAGTIAGSTYGVAKAAQLISVRVFPCSGGTLTSTVIAAVDWVRVNAVKPAVVNYSGGGLFSAAHNQAVQALIASGVTYVTAAGNDAVDACTRSPASTPQAITVGATASNDARSYFSNWGTCVDLFAPGSSISSAWWTSTTATGVISGTSMASPHVAGAAALYLQGSPAATPAAVAAHIVASSTANRLTDVGTGSPNRLLFSLLTLPPPGAAIGLNPAALSFTFVRPIAGTAAAAAGAPAQSFMATGEGPPKPAAQLAAGGEVGGSGVLSSRVTLSNMGTTALNWTAAGSHPWLTVEPGNGRLTASYTALLDATVNDAGLAAGTHTGTLTVSDPQATNPSAQVAVTVNVVTPTILAVGTPRTGLSGVSGSQRFYAVQVPAGATTLHIATSGGTGDADLYVRYGAIPSTSQYDCASTGVTNADSCQVPSPLPGTYYVMVRGFGAYSGLTLVANSGGPPAAPLNLTAVPASATSIRLAWADGSVNETGFAVSRRALAASGSWGAWTDVGTPAANAVSFINTGAVAGTTYQYRLRACNVAGCSAWLQTAGVSIPTAPPSAPFNLAAAATSGTTAAVTWTDGSGDETLFTLNLALRNLDGTWGAYATVATPQANATSFNSTGLLAGRAYRYQLRACNPSGCSAWATSSIITMPSVPAMPPVITGTVLSISGIRVQWTDGSNNETAFTLARAPVSGAGAVGTFVDVATLPPGQTSFTNDGLAVGAYRYRIRACNVAGCSAWNTSVTLTIPPVPAVPGSLAATPLSASQIRLTWTDPGAVETSFQVYRSLRGTTGTWGSYASVGTVGANTLLYLNTGLLAGRAYRFEVRACNVSGCSAFATSPIVSTPAL